MVGACVERFSTVELQSTFFPTHPCTVFHSSSEAKHKLFYSWDKNSQESRKEPFPKKLAYVKRGNCSVYRYV